MAYWRSHIPNFNIQCSYAFVRFVAGFIYDSLSAFLRETRLFHSFGRFLRNHQIILFSPVFCSSSSSFPFFFVMEYSHIRAIVRVCEMCVCVFFSIFIYLLWLASQRVFFAYYVIRIGTLVARNGKEWEMSGTKKTFLHTQQHKRRETARTHARRARTNADRGNGSEQAAPAMPHIRFRSFSFFFFFYLAVSCFLLFFFCDLLFFS